jgi:Fe-S cluster assembly iron-binding protein IscA
MIVDSAAKDYIAKEKTEKIVFDGKSFNVISSGTVKYFFTKQYYEFIIKEIT